jgi:hypothetical protein
VSRDERLSKFTQFVLAFVIFFSACHSKVPVRNRADEINLPPVFLWAWERPEDLEFLDPKRFGVAFLAQTLVLKGDRVVFNPRRQPLKVLPETKLIAVTRIESSKTTGERADLNVAQKERLVELVLKTLELKNISAIQIDFDAAVSEREFYRGLLQDLRKALPDNVPLSMTALASFCLGDRWLTDLPVDEAVPMIFRMGTDDKPIKSFLAGGGDFAEPLCRKSYGITLDEPIDMKFQASRRLYVFNVRAWTEKDLEFLKEKFPK